MIGTQPQIPVTEQQFLAEGKKRRAYLHPEDPNLVVKQARHFKARDLNSREFNTWRKYRKTEFGAWLNPCVLLTYYGHQVVQPRVTVYNDLDPVDQAWVQMVQEHLLADQPDWVQRYFSSLHIWSVTADRRVKVYDYEHIKTPDAILMSKLPWLSWEVITDRSS